MADLGRQKRRRLSGGEERCRTTEKARDELLRSGDGWREDPQAADGRCVSLRRREEAGFACCLAEMLCETGRGQIKVSFTAITAYMLAIAACHTIWPSTSCKSSRDPSHKTPITHVQGRLVAHSLVSVQSGSTDRQVENGYRASSSGIHQHSTSWVLAVVPC